MKLFSLIGSGMRQAIITALVCSAALGVLVLVDPGEQLSRPSIVAPVVRNVLPTYHGPSVSRRASSSSSTNISVPSVPTSSLGRASGGSYAAVASPSHSNSFAGVNQSIGIIGASTEKAKSSGGVGSSGSGGSSSSVSVGAPRANSSSAITAVAATAPKVIRRTSVNQGSLVGKPFGELTVYEGDKPGLITGQENSTMDNPIITSYDQPVGDVLWPMLLMALGYVLWIGRKTYIKKKTIMCLMLSLFATRAWAGQEQRDYDGDGVMETYQVVYLKLGGATGNGDGSSRENAVGTWANAYSKLPTYTGTTDADRDAAWDTNIIVVCDQAAVNFSVNETASKGKPATITGVWPWTADNTTGAMVKAGGKIQIGATGGTSYIGADTKFKYIRFGGGSNTILNLHLYNTVFDVGCSMDDITAFLPTSNGALADKTAPDFQIMMYDDTHDFTVKPWPNPTKPMKLTIRSGKFGRILSCRTTGTTDALIKQRYVIGTPQYPLMGIMELDIDPIENAKWNTKKGITHDIAFCCAGSTQGTEYCDIQYNIKRATIGKLVAATQGMNIQAAENAGISCSSYFGRAVVNLIPKGWESGTANNTDIVIEQYYGACLGRSGTSSGMCNAAFYGISQLNMYGGTIKSGAYLSAGGISGLKSPDGESHTTDKFIPYPDNGATYAGYPFSGIRYQPYDAGKTIVEFTTRMDGTEKRIDLANTVTEFNIYGGEINGGLYGGSYGYSDALTVTYALPGAGSMWGETNVNIYGGTINGGVYGGGYGASTYYTSAVSGKKADFLTVATVYGNTNVNIYGGTINGNIFGGGAGVKATGAVGTDTEFLNIAKVYGNTNVTIDPRMPDDFDTPNPNWTFTGNIFGGGALGAVEGNTNVTILGGIIEGEVFGGGEGENGHPDKAKVTGDTNVQIGEIREESR